MLRIVSGRLRTSVAALTAAAVCAIAAPGAASADGGPARPATPDVAPALTAASFADPPASVRPKYRWWLPLAYADDAQLVAELRQMKQAGAGGAEVAAFSVEGAGNNRNPFLETYGWGTPTWAQKLTTIFGTARDEGLRVDLTIGPRWPATVPTVADVNDPRAQQQLVFAHEFAAGGSSRDGALPQNFNVRPPAGARTTLLAVLAARCLDPACGRQSAGPRLLDRAGVEDVTADVAPDGTLHHDFPGDASSTWTVIAFYQTAAGNTLTGYTPTGANYFLDHLSVAGARATTDFYDEAILTPDVQRLIDAIGDADLYEDSLEIGDAQKWTWEFLPQWKRRRGYDPTTLLPALAGAGAQGFTAAPFFDFPDGLGARVRADYRQTWSDLYVDARLRTLDDWAARHGMSTRVQPYGGPIDSSAASAHVDVPEGESLAFNNNVEDYKTVAVGAHLTDRAVVSDECCAMRSAVWASTAAGHADPANLQAVYRGFAGGVTQLVWHGFPHLVRGPVGAGVNELWPGMTYGGNASFGEAWGAKGGPNWDDYRSVNDALGRMQLVLRQGKPRFDVAVYRHDFGMDGHGTTGYGAHTLLRSDSALAAAGYTYEYLSPESLRDPLASFRGGRLFPDRSAYKALVLKDQRTLALDTAQTLLARARAGLPIAIVGALPSETPGLGDAARDGELRALVAQLATQRSVVRVAEADELPRALRRLGVEAAAAHATDSPALLSVRREADGVDLYFFYNQTATTAEQTLRLSGRGRAYRLDPWSGAASPIAAARTRGDAVELPLALEGDDVAIVAVTRRRDGLFRDAGGRDRPAAAAAERGHGHGNGGGGGHGDDRRQLDPVSLTRWTLATESWTPGPSGLPGDTARTALTPIALTADDDGALPPWSALSPLQDVSGVGTYTARFTLERGWRDVHGAQLDLGRVVDTARVTINGRALPPLNPADVQHVEVAPYLRAGENTIVVRVASTLLNAVRVAPGTGAAGRERMDYGLLGPVVLRPTAADRPTLSAEPLEDALPLAAGGWNRAQVRISNGARRPVRVALDARVTGAGADAVAATPERRWTTVPAGGSRTVAVQLRDGAVAEGASTLVVAARAGNGTRAQARVRLTHSEDLARNTLGTPFPRIFASTNQDRYWPAFLNDGDPATFWVSGGQAPGQGPSAEDPVLVGVDLGAPVTVGSVTLAGRTNYGPRGYDLQTSLDGRAWTTVATVAGAPRAGATTTFAPVRARWVRARIVDGYYTATPGSNVQSSAFEVYASDQ